MKALQKHRSPNSINIANTELKCKKVQENTRTGTTRTPSTSRPHNAGKFMRTQQLYRAFGSDT